MEGGWLGEFVVEVIEGLKASETYNKKLCKLIYEGLNRMEDKGLRKIVYDTSEYDLTIKKDPNTGLEGVSNINILISPR